MIKEIHSKLKSLKEYAAILKDLGNYSRNQLEDDPKLRGALERYMQISLECIIEISEMLISEKGFRKPETYREAILILGEEGILQKGFARKLAPSAGLRNVLVHHYAGVDFVKLYKHLKNDLKDFDTFAKQISAYLNKNK